MALLPLSVPQYPDVPKADGVPPVLRKVGSTVNTIVLLAADAKILLGLFTGPKWGIFSPSGVSVLTGDSVVGVDYRREWRISDYPMEQGGFASYDKVTEPFDVRVKFSNAGHGTLLSSILSGGLIGSLLTGSTPGVTNRRAFLTALDTASASLDLYTVVTPEFSYQDCNIVHYDYRRETHRGATVIEIDVWLRQVRQVASKAFTTPPASATTPAPQTSTANAQSPSAVDATNTGTVQGTSATPAQESQQVSSLPGGGDDASIDIHASGPSATLSPDQTGSGVVYDQNGTPLPASAYR
jgi:hypothetical protein